MIEERPFKDIIREGAFEETVLFMEMMEKDYLSEGFSRKEWVIYGIIAPVVLVIGCVFAEGISSWM